MTKEEQDAYLKEYRDKLITAEEDAMWKRGTPTPATTTSAPPKHLP